MSSGNSLDRELTVLLNSNRWLPGNSPSLDFGNAGHLAAAPQLSKLPKVLDDKPPTESEPPLSAAPPASDSISASGRGVEAVGAPKDATGSRGWAEAAGGADLSRVDLGGNGGGGGERTPAAGRRGGKRKTEVEIEAKWSSRPNWLPENWQVEVRTRASGKTAGGRDKYFYDPKSGHRFRSKNEVMEFLETGGITKYKPKPKGESIACCRISTNFGDTSAVNSSQSLSRLHDSSSIGDKQDSAKRTKEYNIKGPSEPQKEAEGVRSSEREKKRRYSKKLKGTKGTQESETGNEAKVHQSPTEKKAKRGRNPKEVGDLQTEKATKRGRKSAPPETSGHETNFNIAANQFPKVDQPSEKEKIAGVKTSEREEKTKTLKEKKGTRGKGKRVNESTPSNASRPGSSNMRKTNAKLDCSILEAYGRELCKKGILVQRTASKSDLY